MKKVLLLLSFLYMGYGFSKTKQNHLTKMYHHQGQVADKLVCYFDQDPICNQIPQITSNNELVFFMPMTSFTKETKKMKPIKKEFYTISFQEVQTPIPGIKLHIAFDADQVGCECEAFDAITTKKGLVFTLKNKAFIAKLKQSDRILFFAHATKPKIMLDFGHGGYEAGKIGCFQVHEKNINLQVGSKLAKLLRQKGYDVILTRNSDTFVPLDMRTYLANNQKADLFVSLHSNAGPAKASGIETYWMGQQLFTPVIAHNDAQSDNLFFLKKRDACSKLLAQSIHKNVLQGVQDHAIKDRKVKTSVAQVLLGTEMPAALIEMGFLSNRQETMLLSDSDYQMKLARGICDGIEDYFLKLKNGV